MRIADILNLNRYNLQRKNENKLYIPPNTGKVKWQHILMFSSSVIPKIYIPVITFSVWTILLQILYIFFGENNYVKRCFFPSTLSVYLGLVVSLLLVFRNNSAYDRYWEGRKTWASIINHARNLARHIWICIDVEENDPQKDVKLNLKMGVMRLIIALVVSIKHSLRGEFGWDYEDLAELVKHVPNFNSLFTKASKRILKILPVEIAYHIESYIYLQKDLPVPIVNPCYASLNSIIENFTSCERILTTPIPLIYGIHIKHVVVCYLATLPLQIIPTCGWASVIIVLLTSFTFFGIEAIPSEIENPFGNDENDLKLNEYCIQIQEEINGMMDFFPNSTSCLNWLELEEIKENDSTSDNEFVSIPIDEGEENKTSGTQPRMLTKKDLTIRMTHKNLNSSSSSSSLLTKERKSDFIGSISNITVPRRSTTNKNNKYDDFVELV
jgi:putative membrane protein